MKTNTEKFKKLTLNSEVNRSTLPSIEFAEAIKGKVGAKALYLSGRVDRAIPLSKRTAEPNLLIQALDESFTYHRPITLSPDLFWLLILQGFAQHINLYPSEYREQLVINKEKKIIEIRKDILLNDSSYWREVPGEVVEKFKTSLVDPSILDTLIPKFSTTTQNEEIVFSIGIMDTFSSYFEYWVTSLCGIPEIYLMGEAADWVDIKRRMQHLTQFGLSWWIESLNPIFDKIIASYSSPLDTQFWKSIYKMNDESGGPYITGWIVKFFPYLKKIETGNGKSFFPEEFIVKKEKPDLLDFIFVTGRNPFLGLEENSQPLSLKMNDFHSGLSKVGFNWWKKDEAVEMELIGGIIGLSQDTKTHSLIPEMGWCVKEKTVESE